MKPQASMLMALVAAASLIPQFTTRPEAQGRTAIPRCERYEVAGPTIIAFLDYASAETAASTT
jgi:hypothetical protein